MKLKKNWKKNTPKSNGNHHHSQKISNSDNTRKIKINNSGNHQKLVKIEYLQKNK